MFAMSLRHRLTVREVHSGEVFWGKIGGVRQHSAVGLPLESINDKETSE
jgi:hypothetical protein